jgi:nicotinamidase-related amidase
VNDSQDQTREDYRRKGFAVQTGYGRSPVLLVVDFINGFTDPSTPLGGDFSDQLAVTGTLLAAFRGRGLPIIYTTTAYRPDLRDAGMWIKKIPSLEILRAGSAMVAVDNRVRPEPGEVVIEKKFASAFFGTNLDSHLKGRGIDTVIMAGCTTSGCIRSSAIDSMQFGFYSIVVEDAVGDRAQGPHEANLFDIEAKYGDVVPARAVLDHLEQDLHQGGLDAKARDDFQRWWAGARSSGSAALG